MTNSPDETSPSANQPTKDWRILKVVLACIVMIPVLAFLSLFIYSFTPKGRLMQREAISGVTQMQLKNFAAATEQFHSSMNRWPTNLMELQSNKSGTNFLNGHLFDVWKRRYIYTPPTDNASGKIETFGEDGNPDGDKTDGDASIEIKPK